jgi:hypothetical protein
MYLDFLYNWFSCCFYNEKDKKDKTSLLDAEFEHYVVYNDRMM